MSLDVFDITRARYVPYVEVTFHHYMAGCHITGLPSLFTSSLQTQLAEMNGFGQSEAEETPLASSPRSFTSAEFQSVYTHWDGTQTKTGPIQLCTLVSVMKRA